ncbi:hypothetical protein J7E88_22975 [Streptomyces sp. ISL-10]|uniref:hypothetical protein n=1 Tax=Streptomyces sp. ISL-10 TaxID=2819172 RepID=UPI001BECA089|nr:hypothetical protein [Streptomyces sp. ISL-10]MBT2368101.1 hypothetical protein [Streptomyces sp. ISL-10]
MLAAVFSAIVAFGAAGATGFDPADFPADSGWDNVQAVTGPPDSGWDVPPAKADA